MLEAAVIVANVVLGMSEDRHVGQEKSGRRIFGYLNFEAKSR